MKNKDRQRYALEYPSHLEPKTRLWITREGDLYSRDGKVYEVKQVLRPKIKGTRPIIVLEEQDDYDSTSWQIPF